MKIRLATTAGIALVTFGLMVPLSATAHDRNVHGEHRDHRSPGLSFSFVHYGDHHRYHNYRDSYQARKKWRRHLRKKQRRLDRQFHRQFSRRHFDRRHDHRYCEAPRRRYYY